MDQILGPKGPNLGDGSRRRRITPSAFVHKISTRAPARSRRRYCKNDTKYNNINEHLMSNCDELSTAFFTWVIIIVNSQNSSAQFIGPFCRETKTPYTCPTTTDDQEEDGHLDLELKGEVGADIPHWE